MAAAASLGEELLEREPELARLRAFIASAAAGEGRVLLVDGEAGIGKSAILRVARDLAEVAGLTVLFARGGQLERGFAHGVARQLYEPAVHAAPARRRRALLRGAAGLAAPVLGLPAASHGPSLAGDPAFAANHGLYWLTANFAEEQPLVLLVDDAHWADSATLLFLNYLGRRLEGLPVLVALGLRPAEPGAPRELLESLGELPVAETLNPSPLTERASGVVIERLLGRPPDEPFRRACHEVTGGNPFLLEELARALLGDGVEPDERSAGRVRRLGPRSIARSVLGRLGAMWPEALALARAVSVLDTDAELRHAAALAELDPPAAQGAADALAAAHILAPGRPLRFAHPIMRSAVYEDLPHSRRAGDHARAARLLDSEGGDPDRAAVHLLAAEPAADAWALHTLRAAAGRALARGAPEAAAALMRRAVAEPPAQIEWAATLLDLGRAERLAGAPDAVEHLRQALERATDRRLRVEAARELSAALAIAARLEEAVELLEGVIERAPDREAALLLEAHLFGLSQASDALAARVASRLERVGEGLLERQRLRGGLNAVGASSILNPALPFLAAGDIETAETLAEEMLAVAKRWGVAGHTGSCLRALAQVAGGERAIRQLKQAVAFLEQSPRRLELAHALVELGAALRRTNKRADAREPLRAGMELAHRCAALPLAERARHELRATGARPRRLVFTGLDSLTAQERRVAEMAAEGLSNPEIAQALFVTRRTIETHLGHVYRKLDLASRDQLAAALWTRTGIGRSRGNASPRPTANPRARTPP